MKTLKFTFVLLLATFLFASCGEENYTQPTLDEILQSNDLWYVDTNLTTGSNDVRFLSLAFTISFENGNVYANNNLVDIGTVGGGYGDQIGFYNTYNHTLNIDHDLDGDFSFEVIQISNNRIKLRDNFANVTYTLKGYSVNNFDYNGIFYDNIEYFLQEYSAWKKLDTYGGVENAFDDENFLAFIPGNVNVFDSSQDVIGTEIVNLLWDFTGEYEVFDVQGNENLKILTLNYDGADNEEFELSVIDDETIRLYHNSSNTTYEFLGLDNIIYKKETGTKEIKKRKRFKVKRKVKERKQKNSLISNRN